MIVLVDTSAWIALLTRNDQHHPAASAIQARLRQERVKLLTSDYIVDETMKSILKVIVSINSAILLAGCYPANADDCPGFIEIGKSYKIDKSLTVKVLELDKKSCWAKVEFKLPMGDKEEAWINLNAYKLIKPE